jgi:tRNA pseudouridine55 synthase
MKCLKRTRVGGFTVEEALTLSQLEELARSGELESVVVPVEQVFEEYPSMTVRQEFERLLENGNAFYKNQILKEEQCGMAAGQERENAEGTEGWMKVYGQSGRFYGIYAYDDKNRRYQPVKMFL